MAPGADLARGVLLDDRYRLEDVIGQGGMATVYRAHDVVLQRDVAVKLFPPVSEDAEELLRHQAEMRLLAQLSHPGLVTLHDAGAAHAGGPVRQTYLVMELVAGPTLADRLTAGPLSQRHVARLGQQVAEALSVVHGADVVHRDVKPANVLLVDRMPDAGHDEDPDAVVTTGPLVKLADFGIARLSDGARLTVTGTTLGTATYLSPEQASGGVVGPPTDIYALGLVLLECLTGRKAFTGTMVEVAAARLNTSPTVPAELGPAWVEVLRAMTARRPEDRPTAAEVALRLGAVAEDASRTGEVPTEATMALAHDATQAMPTKPGMPAAIPPRVPPTRRRTAPDGVEERDLTHQYSPDEVRAAAERSAQQPRLRPTAADLAPTPPTPSRRGRQAALAALTVLLLGAGALTLTQLDGDAAPEVAPPEYPAVEGPLGDALDELQRSVEP